MTYTRADIDAFLAQKRIALVGVSRKPHHFSRMLLRELVHRGYDVLPVQPEAERLEDLPCCARVADIDPPPDAALILTARHHSDKALASCIKARIPHIWVYAGLPNSAPPPMRTIVGECPFMFLPHPGWLHGAHRIIRQITRAMPA